MNTSWIACSERLPEEDEPVLIILNAQVRIGELRRENPSWEETWQSYQYWDDPENDGKDWDWESVTHWMPLPHPHTLTSEAYFADRDAFVAYVLDKVNPARAEEQLSTVSSGAATHLYDVLHSKCYL